MDKCPGQAHRGTKPQGFETPSPTYESTRVRRASTVGLLQLIKETLHIISITTPTFEINKLYFLGYGRLGYSRKHSKNMFVKGPSGT